MRSELTVSWVTQVRSPAQGPLPILFHPMPSCLISTSNKAIKMPKIQADAMRLSFSTTTCLVHNYLLNLQNPEPSGQSVITPEQSFPNLSPIDLPARQWGGGGAEAPVWMTWPLCTQSAHARTGDNREQLLPLSFLWSQAPSCQRGAGITRSRENCR